MQSSARLKQPGGLRLKTRKRGTGHVIGDSLAGRVIRIYLPLLAFLVVTLFPFYWMAITLAGYSLARLRYRGADSIGWGIFITYLVPPTLLFLPLTLVIRELHLFNNLWALILTYPTFLIPFCTWMLMGFFKGIPRELEEAALVDGATRLQAMVRIAIPLALPGILAAALFAFTLSWNEFLYSLIFMNDSLVKTIPVGVTQELIHGDEFYWGELMGAALLGSIPVAVLYSFFVDHFVAGMTAGAVKG